MSICRAISFKMSVKVINRCRPVPATVCGQLLVDAAVLKFGWRLPWKLLKVDSSTVNLLLFMINNFQEWCHRASPVSLKKGGLWERWVRKGSYHSAIPALLHKGGLWERWVLLESYHSASLQKGGRWERVDSSRIMPQCHTRFTAEGWTVGTVGSQGSCHGAAPASLQKGGQWETLGFPRVISQCCIRFTEEGWTVGDFGFPKGHATVPHPLHCRRVHTSP